MAGACSRLGLGLGFDGHQDDIRLHAGAEEGGAKLGLGHHQAAAGHQGGEGTLEVDEAVGPDLVAPPIHEQEIFRLEPGLGLGGARQEDFAGEPDSAVALDNQTRNDDLVSLEANLPGGQAVGRPGMEQFQGAGAPAHIPGNLGLVRIAPGFRHQVQGALRGLHLFADGGQQGEVDPFTVELEVQAVLAQGKGKGEQGDFDRDRPFPDQAGVQGADFQVAGHLRLFRPVIERGGQGLDGNIIDLPGAQGDLAVDDRGPGGAGQGQSAVELPRGGQTQGRQEAGVQVPDLTARRTVPGPGPGRRWSRCRRPPEK